MKKTPAKNTKNAKKPTKVRPVASKPTVKASKNAKPCFNPWSVSIYVYWFIILFFIAATFYILGRSHNGTQTTPAVQITEEALLQSGDYYESGKTKLAVGNISDAIVDLTAAIDSGAASVDTYILRGEAYMQNGDYANAMADFNSVLEKTPKAYVSSDKKYILGVQFHPEIMYSYDYNAKLFFDDF